MCRGYHVCPQHTVPCQANHFHNQNIPPCYITKISSLSLLVVLRLSSLLFFPLLRHISGKNVDYPKKILCWFAYIDYLCFSNGSPNAHWLGCCLIWFFIYFFISLFVLFFSCRFYSSRIHYLRKLEWQVAAPGTLHLVQELSLSWAASGQRF